MHIFHEIVKWGSLIGCLIFGFGALFLPRSDGDNSDIGGGILAGIILMFWMMAIGFGILFLCTGSWGW